MSAAAARAWQAALAVKCAYLTSLLQETNTTSLDAGLGGLERVAAHWWGSIPAFCHIMVLMARSAARWLKRHTKESMSAPELSSCSGPTCVHQRVVEPPAHQPCILSGCLDRKAAAGPAVSPAAFYPVDCQILCQKARDHHASVLLQVHPDISLQIVLAVLPEIVSAMCRLTCIQPVCHSCLMPAQV